jgi:DNA-binding NtrC family response regulator
MEMILVIEDDRGVRELLGDILESGGYRVVLAENGERGLPLLRNMRPNLVVTDIIMPEKEGIETIIAIRREYPDLKIVAISGGGQIGAGYVLHLAQRLGASEIIAKPFTADDLLSRVARCLSSTAPVSPSVY